MPLQNVGRTDAVLRIAAGGLLVLLTVMGVLAAPSSALGILLIVVGIVLAATAFLNFCPLYAVLGLRTRPSDR